MKLLLDTHLLLWAAGEPRRLPKQARNLIDNPENELLFSAASLWELATKCGSGRKDFKVDPRLLRRGLLDNGYKELPIISDHVVAIDSLPLILFGLGLSIPFVVLSSNVFVAVMNRWPWTLYLGSAILGAVIVLFLWHAVTGNRTLR